MSLACPKCENHISPPDENENDCFACECETVFYTIDPTEASPQITCYNCGQAYEITEEYLHIELNCECGIPFCVTPLAPPPKALTPSPVEITKAAPKEKTKKTKLKLNKNRKKVKRKKPFPIIKCILLLSLIGIGYTFYKKPEWVELVKTQLQSPPQTQETPRSSNQTATNNRVSTSSDPFEIESGAASKTTSISYNFTLPEVFVDPDLIPYLGEDTSKIPEIYQKISNPQETWRIQANQRIDKHRKADLSIVISDASGNPLPNVPIRLIQKTHSFEFGAVIDGRFFIGKERTSNPDDLTLEKRRKLLLHFANAGGFHNALKYKLAKSLESVAEEAMTWLKSVNFPMRGHTLIWPGWDHMHKDSKKLKEDPKALREFCNKQIKYYAEKWDVFEWDVLNEPRANHAIQDILGPESQLEWYKLAQKHVKNKGAALYLNENRVISSPERTKEKHFDSYYNTAKYLVDNGAPLDGLGFQSRFKYDPDPNEIMKSLNRFNEFNLPIKATEFEIVDTTKTQFNEKERALISEKIMTTYFSHPLVEGIYVWQFFTDPQNKRMTDNGDEIGEISGLLYKNGELKPNGQLWLHLIKKHWNSSGVVSSDDQGRITLRAFKGQYEVITPNNSANISFNLSDAGIQQNIVLDI